MTPLQNLTRQTDWQKRSVLLIVAFISLLLVFLFQRISYFDAFTSMLNLDASPSNFFVFSFNKTLRFVINDLLTILIIYALFYERKYVLIAFGVQLIGLFILLPLYLLFKYHYPGYNGPMINFLHRLTLNPILLMMLIPLFFYQKKFISAEKDE